MGAHRPQAAKPVSVSVTEPIADAVTQDGTTQGGGGNPSWFNDAESQQDAGSEDDRTSRNNGADHGNRFQ